MKFTFASLTFYSDIGHGWLRVPKSLLPKVLPSLDISSCSYMNGMYVYLEEDCDAPKFLQAAKEKGYVFNIREKYISRNSHIRRYASYDKSYLRSSLSL